MKKPGKIILSVPEPCNQEWDKMTLVERGRFCMQCNKTVIDFSTYTDKELFNFFQQPKEHVCGNFRGTQLNRLMAIQAPAQTPFWHKVMLGASLAAGIASTASAQSNPALQERMQQTDTKNKTGATTPAESIPGGDTTQAISGIVVDAMHHPIAGIVIIITIDADISYFPTTSDDGRFMIKIDDSLVGKPLTLKVDNPEYMYQEMKITPAQFPYNNIAIILEHRNNVRGDAIAYIISDTIEDTAKEHFMEYLYKREVGTPASLEGPQEPNR